MKKLSLVLLLTLSTASTVLPISWGNSIRGLYLKNMYASELIGLYIKLDEQRDAQNNAKLYLQLVADGIPKREAQQFATVDAQQAAKLNGGSIDVNFDLDFHDWEMNGMKFNKKGGYRPFSGQCQFNDSVNTIRDHINYSTGLEEKTYRFLGMTDIAKKTRVKRQRRLIEGYRQHLIDHLYAKIEEVNDDQHNKEIRVDDYENKDEYNLAKACENVRKRKRAKRNEKFQLSPRTFGQLNPTDKEFIKSNQEIRRVYERFTRFCKNCTKLEDSKKDSE